MRLSRKYTRDLYRNFKYLAAWKPGVPLQLGDIGVLKGKQFTRLGNIRSDFGINFTVRKDTTPDNLKYVSKSGVSFSAKAAGIQAPVGSTLERADIGFNISFSREKAIFFEAEGTYYHSIESQLALGQEILKLYKENKWDKDLVIITELAVADSSTIIMSVSKEGSVDIKVNKTEGIENKAMTVTNPELGLGISYSKNVSAEIIAKEGLTPLFKVSKVKKPFLGSPVFEASRANIMLPSGVDRFKMIDDDLLEFSEVTSDEDGDLDT